MSHSMPGGTSPPCLLYRHLPLDELEVKDSRDCYGVATARTLIDNGWAIVGQSLIARGRRYLICMLRLFMVSWQGYGVDESKSAVGEANHV
jgi:hypothetical protein